MSFRKRGHQELVDNILTELTGGVVNEPIRFTAPGDTPPIFALAEAPAAKISSVTATVGGVFHHFDATDYGLTPNRDAMLWLGTTLPDEGAMMLVDYYPESAHSPITDRNVGSVARTLVEAVGREIAVLYEQLELVYKSGFLDTAEGTALDFVVALLGLERIRAGRQAGAVIFARSSPAPGNITVPIGTVVATPPQGADRQTFEFETVRSRTLRQGQTEVGVPVRFRPTPEQEAAFVTGQVAAGTICLLPKPIVGLETVTNPEATSRGGEDERDEELRRRAKNAFTGASKSTLDALRAAVLRHGPGVDVVVQELPRGVPGEVRLMISGADEEEHRAAIERSLLATKAAGVMIETSFAHTVRVVLGLLLETQEDVELSGEERGRLEDAVRTAVVEHAGTLRAGESLKRNSLIALALTDPRIRDVQIVKLIAHRAGLGEENANRLLNARGEAIVPPEDGTNLLATFDHLRVGQSEKVVVTAEDVEINLVVGKAEVTTAVRIKVTLAGKLTPAGKKWVQDEERVQEDNIDAATLASEIKPQVETLVRAFIEAPERRREVVVEELAEFIERGSGLFTLEQHPLSFFVVEHLATGQVEHAVEAVKLEENEQAEFELLHLELT